MRTKVTTYTAPVNTVEYTHKVLVIMCGLINKYKTNPAMIAYAQRISVGFKKNTWLLDLFGYLKNNFYFVPDPPDIELIRSPLITIEEGGGDCDCLSVLGSTLLEINGYNTYLRAIAYREPFFTHVYTMVSATKDIAFDLTLPGLAYERVFKTKMDLKC
jgi:hypothetical protein